MTYSKTEIQATFDNGYKHYKRMNALKARYRAAEEEAEAYVEKHYAQALEDGKEVFMDPIRRRQENLVLEQKMNTAFQERCVEYIEALYYFLPEDLQRVYMEAVNEEVPFDDFMKHEGPAMEARRQELLREAA